MRTWMLLAPLAFAAACDKRAPEPEGTARAMTPSNAPVAPTRAPAPATAETTAKPVELSPKISRPAATRLVAIGDLHGDLAATRRALRLAGAIDQRDRWIGGAMVVVQTGDAIDRADEDREIEDLLFSLTDAAKKAGGELIALSGNHEVMNVQLDFRYVTEGAYASFANVPGSPPGVRPEARGRTAAYLPGGPYAKKLAEQPIFVRVGDTVLVHGGILPKHVDYGLDRMNDEIRAWMLAERASPPAVVVAEDGPIWSRAYSGQSVLPGDCDKLERVLASLGAKRMVVGHTPQPKGMSTACNEKVFRIDTGMSRFYGGPIEVLVIEGGVAKVKREEGR